MGLLTFLDRKHTVAGPGFSRWMVPPAALCVHLCIGQAYAFSVFNLPMSKLIGITQSAPDDWKLTDLGWIFSIAIFFLGRLGRCLRPLGRGRWAAAGHVHLGALLRLRLPRRGGRRQHAPALDRLSGLWRAGRDRPGDRLYLAGLDPDQMVPRPAGHGDRHGHHGLRGRGLHRLALVGLADVEILQPHPYRRGGDLRGHGHRLSLLHDGGRGDGAGAGPGLDARRLCSARPAEEARHQPERLCLRRTADAAVLAHLVRAPAQCHRRNRRAGPGFRHEPGDVPRAHHDRGRGRPRRPDEPLQHGRTLLLGLDLRSSSAARTPISASSPWEPCSMPWCRPRATWAASASSCSAS